MIWSCKTTQVCFSSCWSLGHDVLYMQCQFKMHRDSPAVDLVVPVASILTCIGPWFESSRWPFLYFLPCLCLCLRLPSHFLSSSYCRLSNKGMKGSLKVNTMLSSVEVLEDFVFSKHVKILLSTRQRFFLFCSNVAALTIYYQICALHDAVEYFSKTQRCVFFFKSSERLLLLRQRLALCLSLSPMWKSICSRLHTYLGEEGNPQQWRSWLSDDSQRNKKKYLAGLCCAAINWFHAFKAEDSCSHHMVALWISHFI